MNRKKSTSSLGFSSLVLLGIAVVIVSSSGIGYVVMKNRQISTRGQISEVQSRIQDHQISILLYDSEIEEALGIFQLRQKLKKLIHPSLRSILLSLFLKPTKNRHPRIR